MSDPVSWFLIEKGWHVIGSDGKDLGKIHEVIGDSDKDIFNGLAVTPGILRTARYVPSERVTAITEGRVVLDLLHAPVHAFVLTAPFLDIKRLLNTNVPGRADACVEARAEFDGHGRLAV